MVIIKKHGTGIGFKSIRTAFVIPLIVPLFVAMTFVTLTLMGGSQRAVNSVLKEMSKSMLQQVNAELDNKLSEANKLNEIHVDFFNKKMSDLLEWDLWPRFLVFRERWRWRREMLHRD